MARIRISRSAFAGAVFAAAGRGRRPRALHLWHPERLDRTDRADRLFRETQASSRVEAVVGLRELAAEASA